MKKARRVAASVILPAFLSSLLTAGRPAPVQAQGTDAPAGGQPTAPTQPAPAPQPTSDQFQPSWTQEKVPPEIKDKEKEQPVAWCPKPQKDGTTDLEVNYYDSKTGVTTTIKYGKRPAAGGGLKTVWKITVKTPGKPKQETTYDLEPGKETKTVQTGDGQAKTTSVDPKKDLADPPKTTTAQATTPPPGGSTQAPQTDQAPKTPASTPQPQKPEQKPAASTPVVPTPTTPGPSGGPPPTAASGQTPSTPQAGPPPPSTATKPDERTPTGPPPTTTWNLKPVTWGGPPPETTITWEPEHPTTPTQVAKRPEEPPPTGQPTPENPWHPGDEQGPQTGLPTPTGGPGGGQPGGGQPGGGWINIGFGWAATRVPWDAINGCTTEPDDGLPPPTTHARDTTPPPAGGTTTDTAPAPTTEQPPPAGTTTEPKPVGTTPPPQPPQQPEMICGPDITRQVLAVLKEMRDEYNGADSSNKSAACDALVSLDTAEFAWDIHPFFGAHGEYPSDENPEGTPSFLEKLTNSKCCRPRYPCGPTVEFFGKCHNMQVVNYAMWGMTKRLCSTWVNVQQDVAHWARNRSSPNKPTQDLMVDVGEKYGKLLEQNDTTDPAAFRELKDLVDAHEAISTRDEKACATTCGQKLNGDEAKGVADVHLSYTWVGLTGGASPASGRR